MMEWSFIKALLKLCTSHKLHSAVFLKLCAVEDLQMYRGLFLKYLKFVKVLKMLQAQHVCNYRIGLPTYFIVRCDVVTARNDQ